MGASYQRNRRKIAGAHGIRPVRNRVSAVICRQNVVATGLIICSSNQTTKSQWHPILCRISIAVIHRTIRKEIAAAFRSYYFSSHKISSAFFLERFWFFIHSIICMKTHYHILVVQRYGTGQICSGATGSCRSRVLQRTGTDLRRHRWGTRTYPLWIHTCTLLSIHSTLKLHSQHIMNMLHNAFHAGLPNKMR